MPSYEVTVKEIRNSNDDTAREVVGTPAARQIYNQTVETLDMAKLIAAVNYKPRQRKARATATTKPGAAA